MLPVLIVGLLFKDSIESLFDGDIRFVGGMLILTAFLLIITGLIKPRMRKIGWIDALVIGLAQAMAVIPGISRSGATISTGLIIGNDRRELARFSFLMVLVPVIGANLLELFTSDNHGSSEVSAAVLVAGFLAAFITGYLACKWMVSIVSKGKLYWFGIYCLLLGVVSLILS